MIKAVGAVEHAKHGSRRYFTVFTQAGANSRARVGASNWALRVLIRHQCWTLFLAGGVAADRIVLAAGLASTNASCRATKDYEQIVCAPDREMLDSSLLSC